MATYLAFRLASAVAGRLPLTLGYWLASLLGRIAYVASSRQRETQLANLRRVLGPAADEAIVRRAARGAFVTWAKNYFDLLRLPRMSLAELERRVRVHGLAYLDEASAAGRGVILVTAHLGCFESVAQMLAALRYNLVAPAEPVKPRRLFDFVNGLRSSHGLRFVPAERGVIRLLIRALRQNEVVGLAVDRDPLGGGIPVEFFGADTTVQPGAALLARRERSPVLAAIAVRQRDNTADVFVEPIPMQFSEVDARDTATNMRAILAVIERYVRTYPDQWVALSPVWRTAERQDAKAETSARPSPVGESRPTHS